MRNCPTERLSILKYKDIHSTVVRDMIDPFHSDNVIISPEMVAIDAILNITVLVDELVGVSAVAHADVSDRVQEALPSLHDVHLMDAERKLL